jgi:hypothetical protein
MYIHKILHRNLGPSREALRSIHMKECSGAVARGKQRLGPGYHVFFGELMYAFVLKFAYILWWPKHKV